MSAQDDLLDMLALRYSVGPKVLAPPGPSTEQWARAAALALRAPDHGGLRPFRFVVVGDSQRAALAELFATGARQRGQAPEEVERARSRAFNGPGLAALVARVRDDVSDVPPHEQWLCVGAALMNFMNALHLMGFGAKALSGASVSDPAVHTAFCGPDERLANWVIAGRPTRAAHAKAGAEASPVISAWQAAPIQAGRHGQQLGLVTGDEPGAQGHKAR
ncbi:MAG: nitroreductase [Burkholderiales bacterium PBB5]|nr:MAG: nitroreductase [Burkholderiales bacterium PBB5]